ncbi:dihydrolipoyl dehydrogenase family protein [Parvularcula lutaonensis]|uniref:Dihydrolipoyl dehydrogenase family protein n=1 Tax=Parvularcula lutaonensis TaxID=491923 RepID=A0ABV7MB93_9PROT|nr:FAD-dependent oxidoreductase [Parvularcula lutaonensis]GGY39860.1 dihydrolipoamide dehydrogenase [Parvularcula lutaonensis]
MADASGAASVDEETRVMKTINADVCVIGAGSAGLTAAGGAGALGRKTILIEAHKMGGDCLNFGCVPSKTLIASARVAHTMKDAARFGIEPVAEPKVDFLKVIARVQKVIADIAYHDSEERMKEEFGVDTIRARANFVGPREVIAGDVRVKAKHFVIATGSSAFIPPIPGLEGTGYLTNETVFSQTFQPKKLLVLGGGPIGAEMAQAHRLLGSDVTIIEKGRILGKDDPELVDVVRKRLVADGIDIREGTGATAVRKQGDSFIVTVETEDGGTEEVSGDQLLVAVGRKANVDNLGLEAAGVEYDPRGIKVNEYLETSNSRIYAVGDVNGGLQFTHVAGAQGRIALNNILLKVLKKKFNPDIVPWVTYTEPELAHVGLTESQLKERGIKYEVARAGFDHNDRAHAEGAPEGILKIYVDGSGKIRGVDAVGIHAGEIIQQFALAVSSGLKIGAFDDMIAPYPTLGEISKAAADEYSFDKLFTPFNRAALKLLAMFD